MNLKIKMNTNKMACLNKLLVLICLFLTTNSLRAVKVDGLYYNLNSDNTCEYTGLLDNEKLKGKLEIPSSIKYKEQEYTVTSISSHAFFHCYEVTEIILPNTITEIGSKVFETCTNLKEIKIPSSVLKIGCDPFQDSGLRTIIFEDGDECLNFDRCTDKKFYMSPYIRTIYLGRDIKYPGSTIFEDSPFCECSTLETVIIGNKVNTINSYQFRDCPKLKELIIGNAVTSIADRAFFNCPLITRVKLPDSLTSIGKASFSGCRGITDLELSNSLSDIPDYAFHNCSSITSLRIPDSVKSIGEYAFESCI